MKKRTQRSRRLHSGGTELGTLIVHNYTFKVLTVLVTSDYVINISVYKTYQTQVLKIQI